MLTSLLWAPMDGDLVFSCDPLSCTGVGRPELPQWKYVFHESLAKGLLLHEIVTDGSIC